MAETILLVEDEEKLARMVELELRYEGYEVEKAFDGRTGLERALSGGFDLVLLDIMLPALSGMEVLRRLRRESAMPVIMLTARDTVVDKVSGLDMGADDYITKPFGIMEFLSRVRAALRRAEPEARPNVYSFREILLDNARHSVTVSGAPVELTYKEYSLLRLLLENTNLVVTRETILQVVWGTDISVESRTVDMHIRTLRKKLGDAGKYICTVRKVGYKLTDSEEELEQ